MLSQLKSPIGRLIECILVPFVFASAAANDVHNVAMDAWKETGQPESEIKINNWVYSDSEVTISMKKCSHCSSN